MTSVPYWFCFTNHHTVHVCLPAFWFLCLYWAVCPLLRCLCVSWKLRSRRQFAVTDEGKAAIVCRPEILTEIATDWRTFRQGDGMPWELCSVVLPNILDQLNERCVTILCPSRVVALVTLTFLESNCFELSFAFFSCCQYLSHNSALTIDFHGCRSRSRQVSLSQGCKE